MSTTENAPKDRTPALVTAWTLLGTAAFLVLVLFGLLNLEDSPVRGAVLLIAAPFAALVPATVAVALQRSSRIERLLEEIASSKR